MKKYAIRAKFKRSNASLLENKTFVRLGLESDLFKIQQQREMRYSNSSRRKYHLKRIHARIAVEVKRRKRKSAYKSRVESCYIHVWFDIILFAISSLVVHAINLCVHGFPSAAKTIEHHTGPVCPNYYFIRSLHAFPASSEGKQMMTFHRSRSESAHAYTESFSLL